MSKLPQAQQLAWDLGKDGWRTPDTYCNLFKEIPDQPGIYLFLVYDRTDYRCARIAYVGMSIKLAQRLIGHEIARLINTENSWLQRWFKCIPISDLRAVERHYIERFNPPLNIIGRRRGMGV